jgi:hypothetical protein
MVICTSRSTAPLNRIAAAASTESGNFDRSWSDTGSVGLGFAGTPVTPLLHYLSRW